MSNLQNKFWGSRRGMAAVAAGGVAAAVLALGLGAVPAGASGACTGVSVSYVSSGVTTGAGSCTGVNALVTTAVAVENLPADGVHASGFGVLTGTLSSGTFTVTGVSSARYSTLAALAAAFGTASPTPGVGDLIGQRSSGAYNAEASGAAALYLSYPDPVAAAFGTGQNTLINDIVIGVGVIVALLLAGIGVRLLVKYVRKAASAA